MNEWALTADVWRGEIWRLWTGHLAHYGAVHLLLNVAAAVPPLVLLFPRDRRQAVAWAVFAAPVISAIVLMSPFGSEYRGASALVVGLWFFAPLRRPSRTGAVLLLAAIGKVAIEMTTPMNLGAIGVAPLPVAHWAGALAGTAGALIHHFRLPARSVTVVKTQLRRPCPMTPSRLLAAAVITLSAATASAQSAAVMHKALTAEAQRLRTWTSDALLLNAVKAQNGRKTPLAEIQKIDAEWISGKPRSDVTNGACADHLRKLASTQPYYVEVFISDNQGALVCSNAITSDYWQGDEDKWTRAFAAGKGAVFIDRPRFDESAKTNLGGISLPIMDGGTAIGVLTVGVFTNKLPPPN